MSISLITVDIDEKRIPLLLIEYIHNPAVLAIKLCETRKGYHIRIWVKGKLSFWDIVYHRVRLGDDPNRIELDIARGEKSFLTNTLFERKFVIKGGKRVPKSREFNCEWLKYYPPTA